jgi:phage tail-like protein
VGIYGIDYFGVAKFGRDPALLRTDFSVDPFASTPLDYVTLWLTWVKPQSPTCTQLQLVRNTWNLPQDETDGSIVFNDLVSRPASYTDSQAAPGFNYYTMWGWDSVNLVWVRCSDLIALLPVQWGYSARLYQLLPAAYRDQDSVLVDPYNPWPIGTTGQPPLQRFMSMLGFEMDFIRSELESLMSVNDAMHCSGALLPLLEYQFGLPNAPEIGMQQERSLVSNAIHLYKYKGSGRGVTLFTSVLTGYAMAEIAHKGYNLLLCMDDSTMMTSVGTWQAYPPTNSHWAPLPGNTGLTLTQIPNLLTVANMTNPAEIIGFEPQGPPVYANSGMRVQGTGTGDLIITTGGIPTTDFLPQAVNSSSGVPLMGQCTFVVQVWSSAARSVEIGVFGNNGSGTAVSLGPVVTGTSVLHDWHQFVFSAPVYGPDPNTNNWPYNWLHPRIRIIGAAANEAHYVTLLRLWACAPTKIGADVPVYDYPRDVKIVLQPQSANMLANPLTDFPYGLDGWTTSADPTQPAGTPTTSLYVHYVTEGDPSGAYTVNGSAGLIVGPTNANSTLWAGTVTHFNPPPAQPTGWFADPSHDWFSGASLGPAGPRPWLDVDPGTPPTDSWFFLPAAVDPTEDQYFSLGTAMVGGAWFYQTQPPQTGNATAFQAFPAQPLDFSVYARYMTVADPTNAVMQIGFRWYFPDGTWVETSQNVTLTAGFQRYDYSAQTPTELVTGVPATLVYPFVRFPLTTAGYFLLNSAQLSPGPTLLPFLDANLNPGDEDYVVDAYGATYFYKRRVPRTEALTTELYRWLPMGTTYTMSFGAGNIQPPLDPTLW